MPPRPNPAILVHGGAWAIPDADVAAHLDGVRAASAIGWGILAAGGSALDAVEAALLAMEDDETFDAGRGSFLTRDGRVQLDALLMDGATLRAGGVGCVERLRHPIHAARLVLERSPHVYFVGPGAEAFAGAQGMELCENADLILPREIHRLAQAQASGTNEFTSHSAGHDTVGALALDLHGHLAAGDSTGGTLNKTPGRVGDSSLVGCGCYADDQTGAAACSGWGEPIMKLVLAKWATDRLPLPADPQDVAAQAIAHLGGRLQGHGGIIVLQPNGAWGIAHNTPRMAWAHRSSDSDRAAGTAP